MSMKPSFTSFLLLTVIGILLTEAEVLRAQNNPLASRSNEPMVNNIVMRDQRVEVALEHYQRLTGKLLIRDANLAGANITLEITRPMPRSEAVRMIEAVLLLNGYAIIPNDDKSVKVINSAASGKNPISEGVPIYADLESLPKGNQVVSYFMPLSYIDAAQAQQIYSQTVQLHTPYGRIVPVPDAQALVITENAQLIREMVKLKQLIDVPPARTVTKVVALYRADAERVADIINTLLEQRRRSTSGGATRTSTTPAATRTTTTTSSGGGGIAALAGDTQLVADPRTNSILVVTRPTSFEYIEELIAQFDSAVNVKAPLEINLRYIRAGEVLPVLGDMLAGKGEEILEGSTADTTTTSTTSTSSGGSGGFSRPDQLEDPLDDTAPRSLIIGNTRLIADKRANSILVIGAPEAKERIEGILEKLDQRPRQVLLSTVIGRLSLGDGAEFGVDLLQRYTSTGEFGVATGQRTRTGDADLVPDPATLLNPSNFPLPVGLTIYGALSDAIDYYVKALATDNRFKILSRPSVFTSNNKKAVILSGERIAVPTSTLTNATTGSTDGSTFRTNIEFEEVVLKLEVIPLINADKEVTLRIAQLNDSVVGTSTIDGNDIPTIGTQSINTTVTIPDGGTVFLGGLITEESTRNERGIPLISKIPLLGNLFKGVSKEESRSELIILIQPRVIESGNDLYHMTNKERERLESAQEAFEFLDEREKMALDPPAGEVRRPAPLPALNSGDRPKLRSGPNAVEKSLESESEVILQPETAPAN